MDDSSSRRAQDPRPPGDDAADEALGSGSDSGPNAAPPPNGAPSREEEPAAFGTSEEASIRDLMLFVPRFVKLVGRLVADPDVATFDKVLLGAAVLYVASPFDLLFDAVPVVGQLDDVYLLSLCLLRLLNHSGSEKLRQHWDGSEDIVEILHTITQWATRWLPPAVREHIHRWVATQ